MFQGNDMMWCMVFDENEDDAKQFGSDVLQLKNRWVFSEKFRRIQEWEKIPYFKYIIPPNSYCGCISGPYAGNAVKILAYKSIEKRYYVEINRRVAQVDRENIRFLSMNNEVSLTKYPFIGYNHYMDLVHKPSNQLM